MVRNYSEARRGRKREWFSRYPAWFPSSLYCLLTEPFIRHATGRDFQRSSRARQAIRVNHYIKPLAGVILATSINENDSQWNFYNARPLLYPRRGGKTWIRFSLKLKCASSDR